MKFKITNSVAFENLEKITLDLSCWFYYLLKYFTLLKLQPVYSLITHLLQLKSIFNKYLLVNIILSVIISSIQIKIRLPNLNACVENEPTKIVVLSPPFRNKLNVNYLQNTNNNGSIYIWEM